MHNFNELYAIDLAVFVGIRLSGVKINVLNRTDPGTGVHSIDRSMLGCCFLLYMSANTPIPLVRYYIS